MKKIDYLEGVRGLAAFLVFVHHFLLAFYPSHYYGSIDTLHTSENELLYYSSPLNFLTNGNFMVCIFFILSGFVLSRKYFIENDYKYLISAGGKRFLRLAIPVVTAILISYIFIKGSFYFNNEASQISQSSFLKKIITVQPTFVGFIQEALYKTMFWGSNEFDTTVWSISIELYGSFLVFGLLLFTHKLKNKMFIFGLVLLVVFSSFSKYYVAFIIGIMVNYLPMIQEKIKIRHVNLLAIPVFIVGLILGGFPSTGVVDGTFFSFLNIDFISRNFILIHILGAFLVIVSVQISSPLQRFFSARLFIYLGKISFGLYLLHPIVIGSFSSIVFLELNTSLVHYNLNIFLVFISTIFVSFIFSHYFTKYIDSFSVRFSKKCFDKYFL